LYYGVLVPAVLPVVLVLGLVVVTALGLDSWGIRVAVHQRVGETVGGHRLLDRRANLGHGAREI
jgi:hypothetical protein